jgi:hypothetical protein
MTVPLERKATCHPEKQLHARSLCKTCYNRWQRIANKTNAACHPDRRHYAKGLCSICYKRTIYNTNQRHNDYLASRRFIDYLKEAPCMDCGDSFPTECMDFDHRPDEQKSFSISSGIMYKYNREAILKEVAKCDLVCANCHRIRTKARGRAQWDYAQKPA